MTEEVKLYVSIPSNRDWKGKFGAALACFVSQITAKGIQVEGYKLTGFFLRSWGQSSCLSVARQAFVDELLAEGYTHWLSLDDDMTFPTDIVDRLISHGKDVVSVNARRKGELIQGALVGLDGFNLDSTGKTGIEEINLMGGAIFLARVDAFRKIPRPHFQVIWRASHNDYVSEDIYFAALLRENGVKLYCDHDASQLVGHIGDHEYLWPQIEKAKLSLVG